MKNYPESIFTSDEVYTSSERTKDVIAAQLSEDSLVMKIIQLLIKWITDLKTALGRTTDKAVIELLLDKDKVRDDCYVGLRDFAKALLNYPDEAKRKAAKILIDIIKELGWSMHHLGYVAESAKLDTLIDKFGMEPAKSAITTLGADILFESLKTAQADFETTYHSKVNVNISENYPLVRNCRKSIARYMNALLSYIDIQAELEGGAYQVTSDKTDEIIAEVISIARARITREKEEKKNKDSKA